MNDATPSNSPSTGSLFDTTDERLAADLKKGSGKRPAHYPAGELLGRHWVPVFSYARLCTNGVQYAGMLTTAAFTRLFGESVRQVGPRAVWRPELLVAVRRIAGEWDADKRRGLLHPELQSAPGDNGRAAALLLPPENRRLVSRAFQRLPEAARCLLWHAEVEAEELAVPARLLGIAAEDAPQALERARELLRQNCLEAHRELAPDDECRRYSRLLDVSLRRGGNSVDPDLRQHIADCGHCQYSAEQLRQSEGRLAVLLAEGVLGWAAQEYLDSRPGRRTGVEEETKAGRVLFTAPETDPYAGPHPGFGPYPGAGPHQGSAPYGAGPHSGPGPFPGFGVHPGAGRDPADEASVDSPLGSGAARYPETDSVWGPSPRAEAGPRPEAGSHPGSGDFAEEGVGTGPTDGVHRAVGDHVDTSPRPGPDAGPGAAPQQPAGSPEGAGSDPYAHAHRGADALPGAESGAYPGAHPYPGAPPYPSAAPHVGAHPDPGVDPTARVDPAPGGVPRTGIDSFTGTVADLRPGAGSQPAAGHAANSGPRHALRLPPHPDASPVGDPEKKRFLKRRNLALAVIAVSGCVLVPLVLWSGGGDDATPSSDSGSGTAAEEPEERPTRIGVGDAEAGAQRGRLRNKDSGDCVGVADGKAAVGAEVVLATCTSSERQQWAYESDGLLRSLADEDLCLDSRLPSSVRLGSCEGEKNRENSRYDFTLAGNLVPLGQPTLALAPVSGDEETGLVLKTRDDGPEQRWEMDASVDSLQMEWITSYTNRDPVRPTPNGEPKPGRTPRSPEPKPTPPAASPTPQPTPSASGATCYGYYCWPGGYGGGGYGGGYPYGGGYGGGGYGGGGYGGR
ncbi:ricin-type beta-trefoil lectin domain protein [Streptomyces sp. NPDC057298]|uniref:ricin-type beta-trefoil lectin domain protein n=1 Tax=Streptomyces sp. NPDC057298 TaxID=3346091 RepID=UPI003636FC79